MIADASAASVTSGTLSGQALVANMELGLLVRGDGVPGRLTAHSDEAMASGTLRLVAG